MAGIKDYSITNLNNTSLNGISVAEGMLPSNLNNAIRALMVNTRSWYNDSQWVEYGDGDGAYTATYASATSFTIAGVDVTPIYHEGRRIKLTATTPGTIYGTISSSTFSTNTTINVTWDSGSLSNEAISNVYISALSKTNNSFPTGVIATATLADGSVTTIKIADSAVTTAKINDAAVTNAKLGADSVNGSKIADDSIDSEHYVDGSIDTAHIANSQITTAKIADSNVTNAKLATDSVTTAKITNLNVTSGKIADASITNSKIASDAVDGTKIADDSINSEHYVDGSIDTQHIADSQITTAKIADSNITTSKIADSNITTSKIANDAVTADKIADAVIVTNAEASGHTPNDTTFFTTSASDGRYFRQDSSETISSGDTWSGSDSYIATTAAIDARIIDLVDDVGGFVAIANEDSFPTTNPDINDGAGTIVSIADAGGMTYNTGTGVSTDAQTTGATTVTINSIPASIGSPIPNEYGMLVETTTTLNTYTFHRLVPIATEVTTVASVSSDITTVAGQISPTNNISTVAGISSDIQTLADIQDGTVATNAISNVGNNIGSVTTTASNIASVNNFANVYRISATAPITSLDTGDLYFDTTVNELKVYGASGWQAAGSSVNGTSQRYNYTATNAQTTFTGADNNGNTLTYDAGYIDVYLNGVKLLNATDVTVTSGSSVVLASGATTGDVVDIVAYGTFSVASLNADNLDSGTVPSARISGAYTGITQTGTLTSFASTGIDDNATSTAITIDSSNRVGIGTASPEVSLHIKSNSGIRAERFANSAGSANLDLNKSRNATIGSHTILQNGDGIGAIIFRGSDGTNYENAAAISAEVDGTPGTNDMPGRLTFLTTPDGANAYTERMRIDSSGNLLIGKTSTTNSVAGSKFGSGGQIVATVANDDIMILNRTGNDGDILRFFKDTSEVGVIGTLSSNLYVGSGDTGIYFNNSSDSIYAINTTTNAGRDNAIDLGVSTTRFKDIYLGGGLYVGGTAAANKLDDYEEGTFTPTINTSDGSSVPLDSAIDILSYTKIGRKVHIQGMIRLGTITSLSGGFFQIIGLPFTTASSSTITLYGGRGGGGIFYNDAGTWSVVPFGFSESQNRFNVLKAASTLGTSDDLQIAFSYSTD
jgi:hypothetical protein